MIEKKPMPYSFKPDIENRKYLVYLSKNNRRSMSAELNLIISRAKENDLNYKKQGK